LEHFPAVHYKVWLHLKGMPSIKKGASYQLLFFYEPALLVVAYAFHFHLGYENQQ
tara:strand:+ start:181 stop:345 length:165 start_codon:yes stop_codon:yes gene_type:complete